MSFFSRLVIHSTSDSQEELLLGQDVLDELGLTAGSGDFVEIRSATTATQQALPMQQQPLPLPTAAVDVRGRPLFLRVPTTAAKREGVVSLLRSVADAFELTARQQITLRSVRVHDAALDWVEMCFKDQQLTRGDIWHFRRHLLDQQPTVHVGKTISLVGIRARAAFAAPPNPRPALSWPPSSSSATLSTHCTHPLALGQRSTGW